MPPRLGTPPPSRLDSLIAPLHRPASLLQRSLKAAWYPLRGIWYFLRNREFHPIFFDRLVPLTVISTVVYLILFTFAFLPQFAFLAIFQGWSAWVNALFLVLGEGLIIIQALFEGFFVDECRVDIFDAVLIKESFVHVVAPHRLLLPEAPNAIRMLGKPTTSAVYTPWSTKQILELIFFLPLNFIPYFGAPAFIIITGSRLGKLAHYRWFQLHGLTKEQIKLEIRSRVWEYTWFGTSAMILELIPVLSFFFLLTSTVGSALWAADLEEARLEQAAAQNGEQRSSV